jgi:toxin ParE1/3/4
MSPRRRAIDPQARAEIREAARWYGKRSPQARADFLLAVSDAFVHIIRAPQRWPIGSYGTRRFVLGRFPFSIVYLEEPSLIYIVAVAHHKRKPGYWKQRL